MKTIAATGITLVVVILLFQLTIRIMGSLHETPNVTVKMPGCESDEPPCMIKGALSRDFLTGDFALRTDDGTEWHFGKDAFAYMSYPVPEYK